MTRDDWRRWQEQRRRARHSGSRRVVRRIGCSFAFIIAFAIFATSLFVSHFIGAPRAGVAIVALLLAALVPIAAAFVFTLSTVRRRFREQDELRRQLMADVAHELRTPLAILQGRIEGLLDGVYPRDDARLGELLAETQHLSRLVEDVRTLANAEAGALDLRRERFELGDLIRDAAAAFPRVTVDVAQPLVVNADPVRIREVLLNLLANAEQHAAGGKVSIEALTRGAEVIVRVRDDGPGIPPEQLDRLFERFQKGSDSRGSGLGLAIARKLVLAHDGTIDVTSAPGAGTTVTVTLRA
ncbi:MAG TPA: HAMP domain-containing sensor histidine kinase [Thermoanaerobaculia bacterium]|nr:HAMP domain-containing sensor histidine kinase [Thermoanaerobaculia bacterium]